MRKKKILTAICVLIIISSMFSVVSFAVQSRESFGGRANFWRTKVSSDVEEKDTDKISALNWLSTDKSYDFKMRFWIQSASNNDIVSNSGAAIYIWASLRGEESQPVSSCQKGSKYYLSSARENITDEGVYNSGTWEP